MPRQIQVADPMFETDGDGETKPLFGTAAHRVQEVIDDQPMDQESTGFYAGDIRDICGLCDPNNKTVKSLKDKIKNAAHGTEFNLPIADVKSVLSMAMNPPKTEPKDPA